MKIKKAPKESVDSLRGLSEILSRGPWGKVTVVR